MVWDGCAAMRTQLQAGAFSFFLPFGRRHRYLALIWCSLHAAGVHSGSGSAPRHARPRVARMRSQATSGWPTLNDKLPFELWLQYLSSLGASEPQFLVADSRNHHQLKRNRLSAIYDVTRMNSRCSGNTKQCRSPLPARCLAVVKTIFKGIFRFGLNTMRSHAQSAASDHNPWVPRNPEWCQRRQLGLA